MRAYVWSSSFKERNVPQSHQPYRRWQQWLHFFFKRERIYFTSIQLVLIPTHPSPATRKWILGKTVSDVQNVFSDLTGVSRGNAARAGIRHRCSIVQCGVHKRIATPRKTSHLANSETWEGSGRSRGHLTQHIRSARIWWEKLKADAACSEAVSARAPFWSWAVQIHTGLSLLHPIFTSPDFNSSHSACFLSFCAGDLGDCSTADPHPQLSSLPEWTAHGPLIPLPVLLAWYGF